MLFATDWPIFRLQGRQREFVERLTAATEVFPDDMSEIDRDLFFFGNARRLLDRRTA